MSNNQVCQRCVMDTSAADITFDDEGFCNYCEDFLAKLEGIHACHEEHMAHKDSFIQMVKQNGRGKPYDCIVGVSGGVDSSYALMLTVQEGLRPLAVHLDNGWNSPEASENISKLVDYLGVDLNTHVINWEENCDLQRSFFKANVVDIELLMDNAMLALNYRQASEHGLKYILSGHNLTTEGLDIPKSWNNCKFDVMNIRRIQKRFGTMPIRTHPIMSTFDVLVFQFIKGIKWVSYLDYYHYDKAEAIKILKEEADYRPYPYKHYESVFTRFYQGHILPIKFGYDKRRPHLSSLVISGQMSRDDALRELEGPTYPDPVQREADRLLVMERLGFLEEEFQEYMAAPEIPHARYGSECWIASTLERVGAVLGLR